MMPSFHGRSDPSTSTAMVAPYDPITVAFNETTSQPLGRCSFGVLSHENSLFS